MSKSKKGSNGFDSLMKPAFVRNAPNAVDWSDRFYMTAFNESYDSQGMAMVHTAPRAVGDEENAVLQLQTPVSGFTPNFRQVEIAGKKDYTGFVIEAGHGVPGIFVYYTKPVGTVKGAAQAYVNLRFMPFATLASISDGTAKSGMMVIDLPKDDILKLNVTLEASVAGEPTFSTHKTEALFDGLSEDTIDGMMVQMNSMAANVVAVVGCQNLHLMGQWPPANASAEMEVECCGPTGKKILCTTLVAVGSLARIAAAWMPAGYWASGVGTVGIVLTGAAALTGIWTSGGRPNPEEQRLVEDRLDV